MANPPPFGVVGITILLNAAYWGSARTYGISG
jgi:hypothetical protein